MKGAGMKKFLAATILAGIFVFGFLCISAVTKVHADDAYTQTWTEKSGKSTIIYIKNIGNRLIKVKGIEFEAGTSCEPRTIYYGSKTPLLCPDEVSKYCHVDDLGYDAPTNYECILSVQVNYKFINDENHKCKKSANSSTGQRFTDNGNGTVTDRRTGLMWLQDANPCGEKEWEAARIYCANLSYAGYSDWRLPTKAELQGIGTNPPTTWESGFPSVTWKMPGAPFTNVQSNYYWSGTSWSDPAGAWDVRMNSGYTDNPNKSYDFYYVWPVRGGN